MRCATLKHHVDHYWYNPCVVCDEAALEPPYSAAFVTRKGPDQVGPVNAHRRL